MREQTIQFDLNGTAGSGFLTRPEADTPAPGVVVIQEWWGLNEQIKDVARRFAAAGFVAIAPDLYHGKVVSEPNEAQKEAMSLDRPRAVMEIVGAAAYLKAQPYVSPKHVGVVGFCIGGGLAMNAPLHGADVGAVVAYYGGGSPEPEAFKASQAAILQLIAEDDAWVNTHVRKQEEAFKSFGFAHEVVQYPGTQHAFSNDRRPEVYAKEATQDAWNRTLAWFHKYLT